MRFQSANDSAPPDKGAETSDGRNSKQPKMAVAVTEYDGSALAKDVFSDPVFYDGDEEGARYVEARRREVLGDMTVDEVRRTYGIDGDLIMGRRSKREEAGTPSIPKPTPTYNG
jgi:hypothetical protein